jgi:hypothetical protein
MALTCRPDLRIERRVERCLVDRFLDWPPGSRPPEVEEHGREHSAGS